MMARRLQYQAMRRAVGPFMLWLGRRRERGRGRSRDAGPFGPPLESGRKLKDLLSLHYLAGRYADGAVPVAWVTSGFPVEILRPLGFHAVYPENHAALCAARRSLPALVEAAEREGYSQDLCSYARCDLGSVSSGRTPVGRLPRPDLLACSTNICQTVLYWYRALAERFGVPLVLVDTPFVYGQARPHDATYVVEQLHEVAAAAERVTGRRIEPEALSEATRLARQGTELWGQCLAANQAVPAPWTGFDQFIHMAPIVALRGTEECNAYYRMLLDELRERVRRGAGGIREERVRLLWDNLPVWYELRHLATMLAERGFTFVCSTYANAWSEMGGAIDAADPWTSAARAYQHVILNRDLASKLRLMKSLCASYQVRGAVLHSDRSCKPYSMGQLDLRERLARDAGVRALVLEADHGDPRAWSPEQAETRLRAFMEAFA
ncbi:MAG TPA: 2-hydroxyacyl-CoA dehydratase family protein [Anaeromyxobacteraceae bacterium]|nr:2-hydroxyacyl-CoA dehydratase family protein [Anaeromyxobacteraceae bacterium]